MSLTNQEFVYMANPHSWYMVADNLHNQVMQLRSNYGHSILSLKSGDDSVVMQWDGTNRSIFLLGGFTLENLLKAFLVYENPQWISDGRLSKHLKTHSLTELSKRSKLIPYQKKGKKVLQQFEDGIESWARYPCGLSKDSTKQEQVLNDKLWEGYEWLVSAYGRRLKKLLSKNWKGPHGFEGYYEIKGKFI